MVLIILSRKEIIHKFRSQSTNIIHYEYFLISDPARYGSLIFLYRIFYHGSLTQYICTTCPIIDSLTQHDPITKFPITSNNSYKNNTLVLRCLFFREGTPSSLFTQAHPITRFFQP